MGVTCWSEAERSQSVGCAEDLSLYKCAAALGINLFFFLEGHHGRYTRLSVLKSFGWREQEQLQWQSFVQSALRV
jgi:hypothetical protein